MKWRILAILTAFLALFLLISVSNADQIMRITDRQSILFNRMIAEIRGNRLIFIGEVHDQMVDHLREFRIIRALNDTGTPLAIGLEMFTADDQNVLDKWVARKIDEEDFISFYRRNWDIPWAFYRDIFLYARWHGIPLLGLNVPREIVHKVAREGFAALAPEERKKLPAGITCNVDAAYMALMKKVFAEHAEGGDLSLNHFCEAQMLWNKGMAIQLLEYVRRHPGGSVIVLAGTGHAIKQGIPREALNGAGIAAKVIIPEDAEFSHDTVTEGDADYLIERR
jgi:uncharacterized iron-regulated protein